MVQIKKQIVSNAVIQKRTYGHGNPCKYITIHETDNYKNGANAQMHANLQSRLNPREASWQYQVDDKDIIQSFPDEVKCWAGGDGKNGQGNNESIHIEICVNSDGNYKKAVRNTAELTKYLMKKHNIPLQNVVQHNKWSGKNCPRYLRSGEKGVNWNDFINLIKKEGHSVKIVKIETGGLTNNNLVEVIDFFRKKGWYGKVTIHWEKGNPKLLSGGLTPSMRKAYENWLKERRWWYRVVE